MQAPNTIHSSSSLSLSQATYPFCLPPYRGSHLRRYHPYPRTRSSRQHLDDSFTQGTVDIGYDGPRLDHLLQPAIQEEDTDSVVVNLYKAIYATVDRAGARDLKALVVALAFAVRR